MAGRSTPTPAEAAPRFTGTKRRARAVVGENAQDDDGHVYVYVYVDLTFDPLLPAFTG